MFGTLNRELTSRDESLRGSEAEAAVCLYVAGTRHCNPASPAQPYPMRQSAPDPPAADQVISGFFICWATLEQPTSVVRTSVKRFAVLTSSAFRVLSLTSHDSVLASSLVNPLRTHCEPIATTPHPATVNIHPVSLSNPATCPTGFSTACRRNRASTARQLSGIADYSVPRNASYDVINNWVGRFLFDSKGVEWFVRLRSSHISTASF